MVPADDQDQQGDRPGGHGGDPSGRGDASGHVGPPGPGTSAPSSAAASGDRSLVARPRRCLRGHRGHHGGPDPRGLDVLEGAGGVQAASCRGDLAEAARAVGEVGRDGLAFLLIG